MGVHGKSVDIRLDNSGDTLTDLSALVDSVDFPDETQAVEVTTFQPTGDARTYVPGLRNATIQLAGPWSATIDAHMSGIKGVASVGFQYGPAGSGSGSPKYTGEAVLTSFQVSSPVGDKVTFSASLQITGAVTRGTY